MKWNEKFIIFTLPPIRVRRFTGNSESHRRNGMDVSYEKKITIEYNRTKWLNLLPKSKIRKTNWRIKIKKSNKQITNRHTSGRNPFSFGRRRRLNGRGNWKRKNGRLLPSDHPNRLGNSKRYTEREMFQGGSRKLYVEFWGLWDTQLENWFPLRKILRFFFCIQKFLQRRPGKCQCTIAVQL